MSKQSEEFSPDDVIYMIKMIAGLPEGLRCTRGDTRKWDAMRARCVAIMKAVQAGERKFVVLTNERDSEADSVFPS